MALNKSLSEAQDHMSHYFFRHAAEIVAVPWNMTAQEELRVPEVRSERTLGTSALHRCASTDHRETLKSEEVMGRFLQAMNLKEPSKALMRRDLLRQTRGGVVRDGLAPPFILRSARHGAPR